MFVAKWMQVVIEVDTNTFEHARKGIGIPEDEPADSSTHDLKSSEVLSDEPLCLLLPSESDPSRRCCCRVYLTCAPWRIVAACCRWCISSEALPHIQLSRSQYKQYA